MEAEGLVSEANWSSFDPAMSVDDVMAHLFGFNDQDHEPNFAAQSVFWSDQSADSYYSSDNTNCNPYYWPQGNCNAISTSNIISGSTSYLHVLNGHESYYFHDANADAPEPMSLITADEQPSLPVCPGHRSTEGVILINKEAGSDEARGSMENPSASLLPSDHCSQAMIKRRLHEAQLEKPADDGQLQSSKKKARISKPVPKKGKNAQSKRLQKSISAVSIDAESNGDTIAQSSSSYSSEDDTSASPELIGGGTSSSCSKGSGSLILNGKKRADRGSATDPQSLYARKRRERINERLKVLQNLVPNGTKVDISTMLEEAVQYVKFLQLQIKLLSSDELWMYAPIAYNGMNLGFDLKISQPSQFPRGVNSSINTGH